MHDCLMTELGIAGNVIAEAGSQYGRILAVCLEKRSYTPSHDWMRKQNENDHGHDNCVSFFYATERPRRSHQLIIYVKVRTHKIHL